MSYILLGAKTIPQMFSTDAHEEYLGSGSEIVSLLNSCSLEHDGARDLI